MRRDHFLILALSSFTAATLANASIPDIASANEPPRVRAKVADLYCRGDLVAIRVRAFDPDGDPLIFSIDPAGDPLPSGLELDPVSGRIRGILRRTGEEGSSTGYDVIVVATDPGGLTGSVAFNIFSLACEEPRISRFVLVNAKKDRDIGTLSDGQVVRLRSRRLSIRVDAYPETPEESFYGGIVESVAFELDGSAVRIENFAPYALGGDIQGDFAPFALTPGPHTLTATPFDADLGGGKQGEARTIQFKVVE
jgi:hypothetical protein